MKFIKTFIIVFLLSAVGIGIYQQVTKEAVPGKAKRVPCMAKVTSFERSYGTEDINNVQVQVSQANFTLSSDTDKATFMDTTLFDYVDMKQMDKVASDTLSSYIKNENKDKEQQVKIQYTVFENDRDDPKKKSKNCKLYRGYVVLKVKNHNNKIVYQNQIDFLDPQGNDVADTIKCAIKAFMTFK